MTWEGPVEVFPDELRRISIPEWRVLIMLAFDGQSTMYQMKKRHRLKYSLVHRATRSLEEMEWVHTARREPSEKGGHRKVYGLTILGLLHLLYRIPRIFDVFTPPKGEKPPVEVEEKLNKIHNERGIIRYLITHTDLDKAAEDYCDMLPLIFGKWHVLQKASATRMVAHAMVDAAHVTLGDYDFREGRGERSSLPLPELFTQKVYYTLLRDTLFMHPQRRPQPEGYRSFDYDGEMRNKIIETFKGDPQLSKIFADVTTKLEEETASILAAIRKVRSAVLKT